MATASAAVASSAPASVSPVGPLGTRLSSVATQFCVDILSRKVTLPTTADKEQVLFARYGLASGLPNAAMQALAPHASLAVIEDAGHMVLMERPQPTITAINQFLEASMESSC